MSGGMWVARSAARVGTWVLQPRDSHGCGGWGGPGPHRNVAERDSHAHRVALLSLFSRCPEPLARPSLNQTDARISSPAGPFPTLRFCAFVVLKFKAYLRHPVTMKSCSVCKKKNFFLIKLCILCIIRVAFIFLKKKNKQTLNQNPANLGHTLGIERV